MTDLRLDTAAALAARIADRLASPDDVGDLGTAERWWPQSLGHGAAGIALLHVERAHAGLSPWQRAHDWLRFATRQEISAGEDSHLHHGAPALGFALHGAAHASGRYARALEALDRHITRATRRRLDDAHARIDRGALPALAEFDAIRGLAGTGAHLLRRDPQTDLLRDILEYLVRLTEPLKDDGETLPGWWSDLAPTGRPAPEYPGGHGNNGVAHGIAGPLALLSLAARRHIVVDGHIEAIHCICDWLDRWRQDSDTGPWWPYWITRTQLRAGRPDLAGPPRASWCYGAAGLARAQQLAALATGHATRRRMAEGALLHAVTGPAQTAALDASLCHGQAGLLHLAHRVAADAEPTDLADRVPRLLDALLASTADNDLLQTAAAVSKPGGEPTAGPRVRTVNRLGLLEGLAGIGLVLHSLTSPPDSTTGWDACLLIT
ncbi:conserved hypothetical protein [Frankia canadensis]|uniref:Lanthionine synthetase C-like protein n=1 Tax=Frankia canadensis TaxID=1836972 RepID=A0A2I2KLR3_9ACTN|nr:lanthionine synthetase C family protein [Frankia canadensis]SNQ46604.1 conserved hypothetical protein [Frankia canadensis]SOU53894.1 conserved hypothetical protein [Frankia canadensis]